MTEKKWTDTIKPKHPIHNEDNKEVNQEVNQEANNETTNNNESNNTNNDIVKKLTEENASLKDKLLRTLAEVENTRRICEEEKIKTTKFAITNISKDLIVVMDNFYRAFENIDENNLKSFMQGMELNFNEFKKIFDKYNIKRIDPKGEMFNPDFHDAISQVENPDLESGIVMEVLQAGYMLNDRVIKPALVVVVK